MSLPTSTASTEASTPPPDICYRCHQIGHFASQCPTKKRKNAQYTQQDASTDTHTLQTTANKRINAEPTPELKSSYRCQAIGSHLAKDCPLKEKNKLQATPETQPVHTASHRLCYICKAADHLSKHCPNQQSLHTEKHDEVPSARHYPPLPKSCFRCHSTEHTTVQCPLPKPCYHCASTEHLGAACPIHKQTLHEQHKLRTKPCVRCGAVDHIHRQCPAVAHRPIYRNEDKDRKLTCYICDHHTHHAVECPVLDSIQQEFKRIVNSSTTSTMSIDDWNRLLHQCARALEYQGALYIYHVMRQSHTQPNADTWSALLHLHTTSGRDQSRVTGLPAYAKHPRSHLKQLITEHQLQIKHSEIEPWLSQIEQLFSTSTCSVMDLLSMCKNRFALCRWFVQQLGCSAKQSRLIVGVLIDKKWLGEDKKGSFSWTKDNAEDRHITDKTSAVSLTAEELERKKKREKEKRRKALKKQERTKAAASVNVVAQEMDTDSTANSTEIGTPALAHRRKRSKQKTGLEVTQA